jgi:hypothetical protein
MVKALGLGLKFNVSAPMSDGDPITSCTVERDHSAILSKPEPSGKVQKARIKNNQAGPIKHPR